MRIAKTRNRVDYWVYPGVSTTRGENTPRVRPANWTAITSMAQWFDRLAYQILLKQLILPTGLIIVLIGLALLVSDSLLIFMLLMLNNIFGILWGLVKFKLPNSGSLNLLLKPVADA